MRPGRFDTFVSCCKTDRSRRKPKGVTFFGAERIFFYLTGILYGRQLEKVVGPFGLESGIEDVRQNAGVP